MEFLSSAQTESNPKAPMTAPNHKLAAIPLMRLYEFVCGIGDPTLMVVFEERRPARHLVSHL